MRFGANAMAPILASLAATLFSTAKPTASSESCHRRSSFPSGPDEKRAVRRNHNHLVIGRLKPSVDIRAAQAELSAISTRLEQLYPEDDKGWGVKIRTL